MAFEYLTTLQSVVKLLVAMTVDIKYSVPFEVHPSVSKDLDTFLDGWSDAHIIERELPRFEMFEFRQPLRDVGIHESDVQPLVEIDGYIVLNQPISNGKKPILVSEDVVVHVHSLFMFRIMKLGRMLYASESSFLLPDDAKITIPYTSPSCKPHVIINVGVEVIVWRYRVVEVQLLGYVDS